MKTLTILSFSDGFWAIIIENETGIQHQYLDKPLCKIIKTGTQNRNKRAVGARYEYRGSTFFTKAGV